MSMRDYVGWETDIGFPFDASIVLMDRIAGRSMPDVLKWAGVEPALTFVDPPPHPPSGELGACREAEVRRDFHWREHVSVYPLADPSGRRLFVLVQRGKARNILRDLTIVWPGGPVRAFRPPATRALLLQPDGGRLVLPLWKDAIVIAAVSAGGGRR